MIVADVQKICNLIGQEEYIIGRIVLSASILDSLTKENKNIRIPWQEQIEIY